MQFHFDKTNQQKTCAMDLLIYNNDTELLKVPPPCDCSMLQYQQLSCISNILYSSFSFSHSVVHPSTAFNPPSLFSTSTAAYIYIYIYIYTHTHTVLFDWPVFRAHHRLATSHKGDWRKAFRFLQPLLAPSKQCQDGPIDITVLISPIKSYTSHTPLNQFIKQVNTEI